MEKLLVLGASIAQVPFVKVAKEMGCYVGIIDYDINAPAIEFSDEYFKCSLLDIDGVYTISEKFKPNGITCGASDVGVLTAAIICERMCLPSISVDTATKVKDKGEMIKAFEEYGVSHPRFQIIENINEINKIEYPVVTKPVDNSGSRGINVAHNDKEFKLAVTNSFESSKVGRVIIEEYLDGPEVSVEILVQNSEPFVLQVTDKITSGEPHFFEMGHSQPSQLPKNDVDNIRKLAYNATKSMGITDGCAHAEVKLTKNGPKMVEIAGRLGGDFITTVLVPISTGVNMAEYEILRSLGKPKIFSTDYIISNRGVAVRFIESKPGRIKSVDVEYLADEMKGVEEIRFVCKSGVEYGEARNNNDRFGYVIATGKSPLIAIERCNLVLQHMNIEME